jgi:hypothetical protein
MLDGHLILTCLGASLLVLAPITYTQTETTLFFSDPFT